jgi:hypothetical protein
MTLLFAMGAGTSPGGAPTDPPSAPDLGLEQGSEARGRVVETMNAAGYTYVRVDTGEREIWAATRAFRVQVGDTVVLRDGMPMVDFYSSALQRRFERIYFVGAVTVVRAEGAPSPAPAGHPGPRSEAAAEPDLPTPERPEGGSTVEELYAEKAGLAGKKVIVRGHVVKFTSQVMGRNWIHIRDGTGKGDAGDLTVTTAATAEVGDTVVVRGTLNVDRDFGHGYRYELIVEDAEVTVE